LAVVGVLFLEGSKFFKLSNVTSQLPSRLSRQPTMVKEVAGPVGPLSPNVLALSSIQALEARSLEEELSALLHENKSK
jgi:hypothetical protein